MQEVGHIDGSQLVLVTGKANQGSEYDAWPAVFVCLPKRVDSGDNIDGLLGKSLTIHHMVYLPTRMVDICGKLVGKYTSPMDSMGYPP